MTETNPQEVREVDRIADHFANVLAGLELLSQAASRVVYHYDSMRGDLTDAISRGGFQTGEDGGSVSGEVTTAALTVLESIDDDDLENPLRGWILQCHRITSIASRIVGRRSWESTDEVELLLPGHELVAGACLAIGTNEEYATLTVTQGLDITTRLIQCPATITAALKVVEDY